jgi:predicted RNA-binding protein Jag
MTETGERSRLMLDIAGYRDQRRKELMQLAANAVGEARESHEPVPLGADESLRAQGRDTMRSPLPA